jgi:hypothetical protein
MHRFVGYRPQPPESYYAQGAANAPNEPQYEGVVFSDGSLACRWLTDHRSTSVWDDWADFDAIHGHPEYGTHIDWLDGVPGDDDNLVTQVAE